jgi:hypothetical protein
MLTAAERAAIFARPTTSVPLAGKLLGIGYTRAYQSAKSGEIPTIKLGRKIVVPTAKLRELLGLPASGDSASADPGSLAA